MRTVHALSDGTFLGSFVLQQSVIEQGLTQSEIMAVKQRSVADVHIYKMALGNSFEHVNVTGKEKGRLKVNWENNVNNTLLDNNTLIVNNTPL